MNKRLLAALGLSLIMGGQCLYATETQPADNADVQQQNHIDDHADFEIIQDNNMVSETDGNTNNETVSGDTSDKGITNVDLMNKVVLTLDSKVALVDGVEYELSSPPTVIENVTLLPMRFVADQVLGAQVDWNADTQTVTMTKDNKTVSVTIDSKVAMVDGLELELQIPPVVKNSTTLVPLRFLSEVFNVTVDYDATTKKITLDKGSQSNNQTGEQIPTKPLNQAPVASFYFPENYVAGQVVSAVSESYDPDGDQIVDQLWSVVGTDKTITNKQLSNMFKTPKAGTYTIGLKVQDSKGLWSEWNYQTVTIAPNQAPIITSLAPTKASFAQGETIEFLPYTYENESWEKVTEGKWTYRQAGDSRETLGKPTALFSEGDYIITLYLDDAYGNRSQAFETTIHISGEVRNTELNYKFSNGLIGEWIDNFDGINYLNYKQAEILDKSYINGTLIMSDSPEEVQGFGILYRDSINGKGRILIHHINQMDTTEKQRLALVVENPTTSPITVKLMNKSIKGPANDILRVGQICLNEYLSGTIPAETIVLKPGEKKYIYDKNWTVNSCISAHIDVETDGEAKFTVANLSAADTLDTLDSLYYYQPDGVHYSGTYDKIGINYKLNLSGTEAEKLSLGVANSGEWVVGYDERVPGTIENTGNFGVSYYITVTAQEDMGVILNNRGGMFQGAVKWNNTVYNMPGKGVFSGTTTKAVVLGTIKKGETVTIEYLLPNGSAAPTLIGFIPKSQW